MSLKEMIRGRIARGEEDRRGYVRNLFGRIAGRYDLTNDVMSLGLHRRWKDRLIRLADIRPGHRVLDLAAGTGDLTRRAAARCGSEGQVVAGDLTPAMMRVGRGRTRGGGVQWVACDASRLPFEERWADRVLVGYGLRNFANLRGALAEILRCLRPGGRFLSLDFGMPESPRFARLYLRYLELSGAAVGWALHRDPEAYVYIPESLRAYPAQRGVTRLMQEAGFVRCGYLELWFGTMAINFGERPA